MKKPAILDMTFENFEVLQERVVDEKLGLKELDVSVKWGQAFPYVNINNRAYRPELLEREIKKTNERIANGQTVWGASYHPADGIGTARDISHKWTKVWMEKDGTCKGNLTLLSTPEGMIVQTLVKAGKLGVSSRGFGTVTEKTRTVNGMEKKYNDVNDDFRLANPGDFVINPSVEGAGTLAEDLNQLESRINKDQATTKEAIDHKLDLINASHKEARCDRVETNKKEENMNKEISEKAIQNILKSMYADDARSSRHDNSLGTSLSFEEWKNSGAEKIIRASCAVESGKYENLDEALREMAPEVLVELKIEQQLVTPAQCYTEARIAGIDPKIFAERINKSVTESAKVKATGWSEEERNSIYREAAAAGKNLGTLEKRLAVLEEHKTIESDPETLFENSVKKRYEMLKEEGPEIPLESVRKVMIIEREKEAEEELKQLKINQIVKENITAGPAKKF